MPIYEFECSNCEKDFQTYTPTMSWKNLRCPKCGSIKIEKKLSSFAVVHGEDGGAHSDFDSHASEDGPACSGNPSNCGRCDSDE